MPGCAAFPFPDGWALTPHPTERKCATRVFRQRGRVGDVAVNAQEAKCSNGSRKPSSVEATLAYSS